MATKQPYGDVPYADPKNGKYPISTKAQAKAAWSYVNMPKNAAQYPMNGVTLAEVKGRIMAACKKFGIDVSESNAAHFAPDLDVVRSGGGMELQPSDDGSLGTLAGRFSEFGRWYRVSSKFEGDVHGARRPRRDREHDPRVRDSDEGPVRPRMDVQIGNKVLGPIEACEDEFRRPALRGAAVRHLVQPRSAARPEAGVYGSSIRFRVTGDEWNDEPAKSKANPDGIPERTITRMKVMEFGPVTFPANPGVSPGPARAPTSFTGGWPRPTRRVRRRGAGRRPVLEDFTGRDGARSAPGGEEDDVQPGNGGPSPTTSRAGPCGTAPGARATLDGRQARAA